MTRKHFKRLCETMGVIAHRASLDDDQKIIMVNAMADFAQEFNELFDRPKFVQYAMKRMQEV